MVWQRAWGILCWGYGGRLGLGVMRAGQRAGGSGVVPQKGR
jgi:hypothetical protein